MELIQQQIIIMPIDMLQHGEVDDEKYGIDPAAVKN